MEKLGRSIADTADSSKPLRGPMGIEWVERAGEHATEEGGYTELRLWAATRGRNEA